MLNNECSKPLLPKQEEPDKTQIPEGSTKYRLAIPWPAPWSPWADVQRLHMAHNPREQPLAPSPTPTPRGAGGSLSQCISQLSLPELPPPRCPTEAHPSDLWTSCLLCSLPHLILLVL